MPPADMGSMHAQYMAGQAASSVQAGSASMQHTMQNMYAATSMGAQTAMSGVQMAAGSVYNGASSALGQAYSVAQGAGGMFQPPVGVPSPAGGVGIPDVVHGAAVGAMTLGGMAGGIAAWGPAAAATNLAMGGTAAAKATGFFGGFGSIVGQNYAAGAARGGMLRGIGTAALGGAGALAVPLVATAAIEKAFSIGAEQMTQIRDINNTMANNMGSFGVNDQNILSPGQANFRRTAENITNYVGNIQEIGRGQAGKFVEGAMQMGLFEGAGAEGGDGITGRARKLADAIKESSRLLNTSMEESLQVMGELRQAGFKDPIGSATSTMVGNRGMARATGGVFSAEQMHGYGMQRAMQFRGAGVAGEFGYSSATQNLTTATVMMQQNSMPDWLAMNLGGRQGVAQVLQQSMGSFMQSGLGQMNVIAQAQGAGGGNFSQMAQAASGQLNDPMQAAMTFGGLPQMMEDQGPQMMQAMQATNLLSVGQQVLGPKFGQSGAEQQITALTGMLSKSQALSQQFGVQDINQARAVATFAVSGGEAIQQQMNARRQEVSETLTEDYMSRNYGIRGAMYKASGAVQRFGQSIAKPIGDMYTGAMGAAQELTQDISHMYYGTRREVVGSTMEDLAGGMADRILGINQEGPGLLTGTGAATSEAGFERLRGQGLTQKISAQEYLRNRKKYVIEGGSEMASLIAEKGAKATVTDYELATGQGDAGAALHEKGSLAMVEVAQVSVLQGANQSAARVKLAAEQNLEGAEDYSAVLKATLRSGDRLDFAGGTTAIEKMIVDPTGIGSKISALEGRIGRGGGRDTALMGELAALREEQADETATPDQMKRRREAMEFRKTYQTGLRGRLGKYKDMGAIIGAYKAGDVTAADLIGSAAFGAGAVEAMKGGATPEEAAVKQLEVLGLNVAKDERLQKELGSHGASSIENQTDDPEAALDNIANFMFGRDVKKPRVTGIGSMGAFTGQAVGIDRYTERVGPAFKDLTAVQKKGLQKNLGKLGEIGKLMRAGEDVEANRLAKQVIAGIGGDKSDLTATKLMTMAEDEHSAISGAAKSAMSVYEKGAIGRWTTQMSMAASEVDLSDVKDKGLKESLTGLMTGLSGASGRGYEALVAELDKQEDVIQQLGGRGIEELRKKGSGGRALAKLIEGKIGKDREEMKLDPEEVKRSIMETDVTGARTVARDGGRQAELDVVTREMYMNMKAERQVMSQMAQAMAMVTDKLEGMGGGNERVGVVPTSGSRGPRTRLK